MLNYSGFLYEKRDHRGKIKKFANVPEIFDWAHDLDANMALWIADKLVKDMKHFFETKRKTLAGDFDKWLKGEPVDDKKLDAISKILSNAKAATTPKIRKVLDYVNSPLHQRVGEPGSGKPNINKLTLKQAVEKSEKWHEEIKNNSDRFLIEDEAGEIILEFPDGYYWIDLQSTSCSDEASAMGHCGNTNRGTTILSLRRYKQPHVTIAWDENDNIFTQIKGKGNDKPIDKYHTYIVDLICSLKIERLKSEYQRSTDFDTEDLDSELYAQLQECNPEYVENSVPMTVEELEDKYREDLAYHGELEEELTYIGANYLWQFIDDDRYLSDMRDGEVDYYLEDFEHMFEQDWVITFIESNVNYDELTAHLNEDLEDDLQEIRDDNEDATEEELEELLDERRDKDNQELLEEMDMSDLKEILEKWSIEEKCAEDLFDERYDSASDVYWQMYGDPDKATGEDLKEYGFFDYIDDDEAIEWLVDNSDEDVLRDRYDE